MSGRSVHQVTEKIDTARILLLSGSLRASSTNSAILRTAMTLAPRSTETVLFPGIGHLPHFSPDLDAEPLPEPVQVFREELSNADAIVISTPEYAGGMPGSFKNALDWAVGSFVLHKKPVALWNVSSNPSTGHAAETYRALRITLGYLDVRIVEEACLHVPLNHQDVSADGIIGDSEIQKRLHNAMEHLVTPPARGDK